MRQAATAARDQRVRDEALRRLEEVERVAADELRGLVSADSPAGQRRIVTMALAPLIDAGVLAARLERTGHVMHRGGHTPVYAGHRRKVYLRGPRWGEREVVAS